MRESWIVESKLTPATPPPGWLYREGLPAGSALPPISLFVAGPGYGKTLALVALSMRALHAGLPVLYYALDAYDAEPATFFHYLVAGMQRHIPQFGEEVKALLASDKLEPRLLFQRFFQAIAAYNLPGLLIVLDDVQHLLDAPELLKAFMYFWDKLPPGTKLAVASRRRLPQGVSKLQVKGQLRLFEEAELRFSPAEEDEFMRRRAQDAPVPEAWRRQCAGLDGWPLGMDLATTVAPDRALRLDAPSTEALMTYVAEELYEAQDEPLRHFMRQAALLQELTPDAARWVFQTSAPALNAVEALDALEALHLVQRLEGGVGYRFPTYLREFLLAEGERTLDALAIKAWHRRAAQYYQDRRQEELALPHWLAAQEWAQAAANCAASFPAMRLSGRQALMTRWLSAFPAEIAASEPLIQLWRGHVDSRAGRHTEAAPAYERAYALFAERDDQAGMFKVLVRQTTLALIQETDGYKGLLMRAMALQASGLDEDVVDLHLTRALASEQRGDMALMRECNEAVLERPVGENIEIAASHTIARINLYTAALHRGDLAQAHRHIAEAIELAERWSFYPYHLFASFLQAHLRVCEGDLAGAGAFVRGLPPHWTDLLDWHDLACAHTVIGYYHLAKGDAKEAEEALKRSYATFEKAGFKEGLKVPLERLLWLAIQRRQYGRTSAYVAEAEADQARNIYDWALLVPHAEALHLAGDSAAALAVLARVLPALESQSADLHRARALLIEAAARLALEGEAAALAPLTAALALAEQRDYRFLPGQDRALWDELVPLVARHRLHLAFVEQALSERAGHSIVLAVPADEGAAALAEPAAIAPRQPLAASGTAETAGPFGAANAQGDEKRAPSPSDVPPSPSSLTSPGPVAPGSAPTGVEASPADRAPSVLATSEPSSLSSAADEAASPPPSAPASPRRRKDDSQVAPTPAGAGALSVHTFGGFEVRLDGVLLDAWPRRKAKLILAALVLYPRGLTLTALAEVLGAEEVSPAALTTLKVDVSSLRKTLEPDMAKGGTSRYVEMNSERYVLNPQPVEFLDLRAFDTAHAEAEMARDRDAGAAAAHYETALAHFRGNLLDDPFFLKFFEAERERYRQLASDALLFLAQFRQGLGDMSGAEAHLRRLVDVAPCDEEAYIALMRHQLTLGRPERVRQVYWDCRKALKAHLGLTPSDAFETAYRALAPAP